MFILEPQLKIIYHSIATEMNFSYLRHLESVVMPPIVPLMASFTAV